MDYTIKTPFLFLVEKHMAKIYENFIKKRKKEVKMHVVEPVIPIGIEKTIEFLTKTFKKDGKSTRDFYKNFVKKKIGR